jgi:hypothetical protein
MKPIYTLIIALLYALFAAEISFASPNSSDEGKTDCYSLGAIKADELGGELAKVSPDKWENADTCHIVVLIPSKNGERPQRIEIDIAKSPSP